MQTLRNDLRSGSLFFKIGMGILTAPIWLALFVPMLPELLLSAIAFVLHCAVTAVMSTIAMAIGSVFRGCAAIRRAIQRT
jgi:hypothetical protein